ncbi:MAG TPA: hypothetical protein VGO64_04690, partial [Candidatus Limnocylindrales bacterium]|nr:hypothetical protein [Candidatus Limnocylindrales bacterium]
MNLRPARGTDPAEEERLIREMTLDLETLATGTSLAPPIGFTDQVMAAIVDEPLPQPVRAFGLALAAGRLRAAGSAVGDAWRVATSGFAPIAVRAQAFALVLIVAVGSATVAGGAAVGAATLFAGPPNVPSPTTPVPSPSLVPSTSPDPSPTFEPSASPSPTDTAGPTG